MRRCTEKAVTRCSKQPEIPVPVGKDRLSIALEASSCTAFTNSLKLAVRFKFRMGKGAGFGTGADVSCVGNGGSGGYGPTAEYGPGSTAGEFGLG